MASANDVQFQLVGDNKGSTAGNFGFKGLAPNPDNNGFRFSVFLGKAVDRQSLVESQGTLVHEATLRLHGVKDIVTAKRMVFEAKLGETVLGHALVASGVSIQNNDLLVELTKKVDALATEVKALKK